MSDILYIPASKVKELLDWDKTLEAVEIALKSVTQDQQNQKRIFLSIEKPQNRLYSMLGELSHEKYGGVVCKLLSMFPGNSKDNKPTSKSNIILFDEKTGFMKAMMAAEQITDWRTAAASAIATKYLHHDDEHKRVLAVLGAGHLGKAHALCFQHLFKFKEVRIWNRTIERANKLVDTLNKDQVENSKVFRVYDDIRKCVEAADVIVTATSGTSTLITADMLKKGVHINALRVDANYQELDNSVYDKADVFVDSFQGANVELKWLKDIGGEFKAQIGDLISSSVPKPTPETTTIFQSLGMAIEDCSMARLIYDLYIAAAVQ